MKYALIQVLPDIPPGGVCAGIDWAAADHVIFVVDMAGRVADRFTVMHDKAGIATLIARLRKNGVSEVAIERGDGVLVAALLDAGLTVVVITSRQVKNLRSRYSSAGGKDDRFDSYVLADTLRTDRARLRPLVPDTPETIELRAVVRIRKDLIAHKVAACNQLRAHLAAAFPGAAGLFYKLGSPISLAFLSRFGSREAAGPLDEQALAQWLGTLPSRGNAPAPRQLAARLAAAPAPAASSDGGMSQAAATRALTATVTVLTAQISDLETRIAAQLAAHPDGHIFTSLPAPARFAPPACWPRPATAGPGSPTPRPWPPSPGSHRSPASPAATSPAASGGQLTTSSATPCATSPTAPGTPARGPHTSTPMPAPAAKTTRTPSASWPAPGMLQPT